MRHLPVIATVFREKLLKVCGRISDSKAPGMGGVPNKAIPDMFVEFFEACIFQRIFPTTAEFGTAA